jgi:uncharacterized membrane protein (UPF0127 family)
VQRLLVTRVDDGRGLFEVEVGSSFVGRLRGLMGRPSLAAGEGLYLPGTNSIHMLFMRFAIDAVFVGAADSAGIRHVVDIKERLRPWTGVVWWVRGLRGGGVIEVPAGAAAGAGMRLGDRVRLEPTR